MKRTSLCIFALIFSVLFGCHSSDAPPTKNQAISFERTDECHVCGMAITGFVGPKGQAFGRNNNQAQKFCSTLEMLYWYLQPENQANVGDMYVHDMAQTPWDNPSDTYLIAARDAFYVVGATPAGSMGATLASFLDKNKAAAFAQEFGGDVVTFDAINLDMLSQKNQSLNSSYNKLSR